MALKKGTKKGLRDLLTRDDVGKRKVAKKGDIVVSRSGVRYVLADTRGTLRRLTPKPLSKKARRRQKGE